MGEKNHLEALLPLAAALVALAAGLAGSPLGDHWLDTGEFTATSWLLGLSHPPGHPLATMVTRTIMLLPLGSIPFRGALSSGVAHALSTGILAWILALVAQRACGMERRAALWWGAAGAVLYATVPSALFQAVRTEVYALNAALALGALALGLAQQQRDDDRRWLLCAAFISGLALANHHFVFLLVGPAILAAFLLAPPHRIPLPRLLGACLLGAVGLLCYAYLPVRALTTPEVAWGDPTSPAGLWWVVSAAAFQKSVTQAISVDLLLTNLWEATFLLMDALGPVLFVIALVGMGWLAYRRPRLGIPMVIMAAGGIGSRLPMGFDRHNPDLHGYMLPALAAFFPGMVFLMGTMVQALRTELAPLLNLGQPAKAALRLAGFGLLIALVLFKGMSGTRQASLRTFSHATEVAAAYLDPLPPHAVVVTSDFNSVFLLWGYRAATGARPDVSHLHRSFLRFPGYAQRMTDLLPDVADLIQVLRDGEGFPEEATHGLHRPVLTETYFDLGPSEAARLSPSPSPLLFHVAPGPSEPGRAAPVSWEALYHRLPGHDQDVQTLRFLLYVHYLQAQHHLHRADGCTALVAIYQGLNLNPESPELAALKRQASSLCPEGL